MFFHCLKWEQDFTQNKEEVGVKQGGDEGKKIL